MKTQKTVFDVIKGFYLAIIPNILMSVFLWCLLVHFPPYLIKKPPILFLLIWLLIILFLSMLILLYFFIKKIVIYRNSKSIAHVRIQLKKMNGKLFFVFILILMTLAVFVYYGYVQFLFVFFEKDFSPDGYRVILMFVFLSFTQVWFLCFWIIKYLWKIKKLYNTYFFKNLKNINIEQNFYKFNKKNRTIDKSKKITNKS